MSELVDARERIARAGGVPAGTYILHPLSGRLHVVGAGGDGVITDLTVLRAASGAIRQCSRLLTVSVDEACMLAAGLRRAGQRPDDESGLAKLLAAVVLDASPAAALGALRKKLTAEDLAPDDAAYAAAVAAYCADPQRWAAYWHFNRREEIAYKVEPCLLGQLQLTQKDRRDVVLSPATFDVLMCVEHLVSLTGWTELGNAAREHLLRSRVEDAVRALADVLKRNLPGLDEGIERFHVALVGAGYDAAGAGPRVPVGFWGDAPAWPPDVPGEKLSAGTWRYGTDVATLTYGEERDRPWAEVLVTGRRLTASTDGRPDVLIRRPVPLGPPLDAVLALMRSAARLPRTSSTPEAEQLSTAFAQAILQAVTVPRFGPGNALSSASDAIDAGLGARWSPRRFAQRRRLRRPLTRARNAHN